MKRKTFQSGRAALDLIEDAVHLLRTSPASVWITYYAGAVPFVLGLLYFWADMSCGAYAQQRCPASALGLVILFVWLKCWQSVFTDALRSRVVATEKAKWTLPRIFRLVVVQGIVQPSRLFVLPVALIVTVPFGWVMAFYENFTVLGNGTESSVRRVCQRAAAQSKLWPKQNHILLALLSLVALVLWLNALIAVSFTPRLLKLLLGIETAFDRAGVWVIFNTTFLAVTVAMAWLILDPLVKAVYTLRCFHGEARTDGADLLAELSFVQAGRKAAVVVLLLFSCLLPFATHAADKSDSSVVAVKTSQDVPPVQIDDAVKKTLQRDKYAWRLPRQKVSDKDNATRSWIAAFLSSIGHTIADWMRTIRDWIRDVIDWFDKHFKPKPKHFEDTGSHGFGWIEPLRWFAYALLTLAGAALVMLGVRLWRQGGKRRELVVAEVVSARPDLNDENVTAAQLPEDEWLKLARELLDQGDLRLALRALYLATLAHLASREIVSIARFKSNHDYEIEVNRRARGLPELREAFAANVHSFDRTWYGLYEVTSDALAQFQSNFERIRAC
jgi:hypothetical protein